VLELQRLAISAGLSVAVDFEYRAVPLFQQLEALLRAGAIGDPWLVTMDWLMGSRADASRPWSWYSQRSEGGGVLGALGTHAFDILQWLVGPCTALSASLRHGDSERPLPDGSGRQGRVDADDSALLGLELEGERGQRIPAQLALSSVTRQGRGCWLELALAARGPWCWQRNRSDYVHGFQLWQASWQRPVAAAGSGSKPRLRPNLGGWPDCAGGSPPPGPGADKCGGGTADAAGPGRGLPQPTLL